MLKTVITLGITAFGLAMASIGSVDAAEAESGMPKNAERVADGTNHRYFTIPKQIQLTTEQKTALDEIKQQHAPKLAQLSSQFRSLLTDDQKAARKVAIAKARMDGVKGKDRTAAIDLAVNMTDEQKKTLAAINPELAKLRLEIKQQIFDLLTEEQRTHFKLPNASKSSTSSNSKSGMPNS